MIFGRCESEKERKVNTTILHIKIYRKQKAIKSKPIGRFHIRRGFQRTVIRGLNRNYNFLRGI